MTDQARDQLTAVVLLVVSAIWISGVYRYIPEVQGAPTSPRTFPLAMGLGLAALSAILLLSSLFARGGAEHRPAGEGGGHGLELKALACVFGFLAGYIALLSAFGFILATIVVVAAFLWFVLRRRSPGLILGLSFGLAFGIWLVLNKLMAVYLPRGELFNLF